jgi:small subunit ribosomal protein S19e
MGVYDVKPEKFIEVLVSELEKMPEFQVPEWAAFVKTSSARVRPPMENKFWYKRAASILRQIFLKGVVGVGRLRTKYGGRKKRGVRPEKFRKAGGKIIRVILQQAEKAGLIEKVIEKAKGKRAGRQLTKKGKEILNAIK